MTPRKSLVSLISIIFVTAIAIMFDVPVLRPVLGFFAYTVLPGMLILLILRLDKLERLTKILLSVGISVIFLILFGLLINQLYFALGYATPLATNSLVLSLSVVLVSLAIGAYKMNKEALSFHLSVPKLNNKEKALLLLPLLLPTLSILGTVLMNVADNNVILLSVLLMIAAYVAFVAFVNRKVSERIYPTMIFLISISLLIMPSLRTNHLLGFDTHNEYGFFQLALSNLHWSLVGNQIFDACLSISLLPAIYQSVMNINPEYLFKILFSLLFSLSPLCVYVLAKRYLTSPYPFLAAAFYMCQVVFLRAPMHARNTVAILFVALVMVVLFSDMNMLRKRLLFILFLIGVLVSHYSVAYILLFMLFICWLGTTIYTRVIKPPQRAPSSSSPDPPGSEASGSSASLVITSKYAFRQTVTLTGIALFFVMIFLWYSQLTEVPFTQGVRFIQTTLYNLQYFFIIESRGGAAAAYGVEISGIPRWIHLGLSWLYLVFIMAGIAITAINYKKTIASGSGQPTANFLRSKFSVDYFMISIAAAAIAGSLLVLPYVARGYDVSRTNIEVMLVLCAFFVLGGATISRYLKYLRRIPYLLVLLVVIPYLLASSGVLYQAFGIPQTMILNSSGDEYDILYIHEEESRSAKWLREYYGGIRSPIICGLARTRPLISQGGFSDAELGWNIEVKEEFLRERYLYLGYYNITQRKLWQERWFIEKGMSRQTLIVYDLEEMAYIFGEKNKLYTNTGSEIYR